MDLYEVLLPAWLAMSISVLWKERPLIKWLNERTFNIDGCGTPFIKLEGEFKSVHLISLIFVDKTR